MMSEQPGQTRPTPPDHDPIIHLDFPIPCDIPNPAGGPCVNPAAWIGTIHNCADKRNGRHSEVDNGTMTITEFLLARIAEDEAVARSASPGPWKWEGDYPKGHCPHDTEWTDHGPDLRSSVETNDEFDHEFRPVITSSGYDSSGLAIEDADAEFIAANNPARVLAECAAKRAIIERAMYWDDYRDGSVTSGVSREMLGEVLRHLAAVYADHEDYQQEWDARP